MQLHMMKIFDKFLATILTIFLTVVEMYAQQPVVKVSGTVQAPKNYEISVNGKLDNKSFRVLKFIVDSNTSVFSLGIPYNPAVKYDLQVSLMKRGKRTLEVDRTISKSLQLHPGQNLTIAIHSAQFGDLQKTVVIGKEGKSPNGTLVIVKNKSNFNVPELSLDKVVNGQLISMQTSFVNKVDSSFYFFAPIHEEGFYYLSTIRSKKQLYLKPNEVIQLDVDAMKGQELRAIQSSEENKLIAKWEKLTSELVKLEQETKPDSASFIELYQSLQAKTEPFLNSIRTKNDSFNKLFSTSVKLDNNLLGMKTLLKSKSRRVGPFWIKPKEFFDVPSSIAAFFVKNKIESTDILKIGNGFEYISLLAKFNLYQLDASQRRLWGDTEKVNFMVASLTNEDLKPVFLQSQLIELESNVSNYSEFRDAFMPHEQYVKTEIARNKYNQLLNMFAADTVFIGKSSCDFSLPDTGGKMVSMKDFKGKVIFIDTWATWCGPCKAQMPFMKEIEEHYHGNDNLVFVGISLDAEKDKQKWLDMIKEKELGGVQLLDSKGVSFAKKYKINAIPRFLLIDKEGNWVEMRCPLPETKDKLIRYIDKELARTN